MEFDVEIIGNNSLGVSDQEIDTISIDLDANEDTTEAYLNQRFETLWYVLNRIMLIGYLNNIQVDNDDKVIIANPRLVMLGMKDDRRREL